MKILSKSAVLIITVFLLLSVAACSLATATNQADKVCDVLSEKYGEEFIAGKYGDRVNTSHTKFYLSPKNNPELQFVATIDRETGEVEDTYVKELISFEVSEIIFDALNLSGITATVRTLVITKDPVEFEMAEYTPESFLKSYDIDHYFVYVIVEDDGKSMEDVADVLKEVSMQENIRLIAAGYLFASDNYQDCLMTMREYPDFSSTMIEDHSPLKEFTVRTSPTEFFVSED